MQDISFEKRPHIFIVMLRVFSRFCSIVFEKELDSLDEVSRNVYFINFINKTRVPHLVEFFVNVNER